jgi:hypothetical protein
MASIFGKIFTDAERRRLARKAYALGNQDIGARLGLTEATVKWYLHQSYESSVSTNGPTPRIKRVASGSLPEESEQRFGH